MKHKQKTGELSKQKEVDLVECKWCGRLVSTPSKCSVHDPLDKHIAQLKMSSLIENILDRHFDKKNALKKEVKA